VFQWLAAALILWRTRAHGIPQASLGLTIGNARLIIVTSVVLCALILVNQVFSLRRMFAHPLEIKGVLPHLVRKLFPQDGIERSVFFGLVLTVAFCEEFIYRGFVQRAFEDWLEGSITAGILISAMFFGLAHFYQGWRGMLSTFALGLVFSGMREWSGSLAPAMAAHFVADLSVGFLAPYYLRGALVDAPNSGIDTPGT
jgi:membrane protease YdiL (CAAX protease family)